MAKRRSRRGGAAAPSQCKTALGRCMTGQVRGGRTLGQAGRACMKAFNVCRSKGKRRGKKRR